MTAISDSHNYRKHEQVARDLERAFGHERVQGAHIEREGKQRPTRTPSHADMLQAERTGLSVKTVKAKITALWRRADSGQAFAAALKSEGYVLVCGDRRDFWCWTRGVERTALPAGSKAAVSKISASGCATSIPHSFRVLTK